MKVPGLNTFVLPKTVNDTGMGYLMSEADKIVSKREIDISNGVHLDKPDFLQ